MSKIYGAVKKIEKIIRFFIYKMKYKDALIIHKDAYMPKSTVIRINSGGKIYIGKNVELRECVILNASNGGIIELQENVFINDFSCINAHDHVLIEAGTQLGQSVKIYDHDHDYSVEDFKHNFKTAPVTIGKSVWIGSNVCILRGSQIGSNCVIGAGTVIKGIIEDSMLVFEKKEMVRKIIKRRC